MSYSRDISLEAEGAKFYFRFLDWDTKFFGINSYLLDTSKSLLAPSARIKNMARDMLKKSFVTLKIDSGLDRELQAFLQSMGFDYITSEISLNYTGSCTNPRADEPDIKISELKENMGQPSHELGRVFEHTRFHSDIHIPREKADELWINYVRTFKPSKTESMFVAEYGGRTAGSIMIVASPEEKTATLFFVGVIKGFQGRGVGSAMIRHVTERFKDNLITVGTQEKNIPALNFYIKNGFSVINSSKLVYHRWA